MTADNPSPFVPKLRFPEFAQGPGWDRAKFADLVETVTPPKKLTTSTYLADGRFPIIDQSPSYFCGWTNDDEAVITKPLPVIVFGDHTCVLKFVDQPFAQGADGIKIFTARSCVSTVYLYHQLSHRPVVTEQYQRHFSTLKNKVVCFPDFKSGEQQKIADCLGSLDDLIAAEGRKLDALRQRKQGLMQQLFPQPGENVPMLRHPGFRDSGEWEAEAIGSVCELYQPETLAASELQQGGPYLVYGANGIIGKHDRYNHEDGEIVVTCRGATCGEVNRTQPRSWITGNAMVVKSRDDRIIEDFIFHSLKSNGLKSIISGSAQPQITRAGFSPLLFVFPESKDEQQKIADCLNSLDDLTAAESSKLDALRQHKKALQQQLFPSLEGQ